MMATVTVEPATLVVGDEYTLRGSGFVGPFVRVSVTYLRRAETYKAEVAAEPVQRGRGLPDGETDEAFAARQRAWAESGLAIGDISLTEVADQPGAVDVVVWDWPQRRRLAETGMIVRE